MRSELREELANYLLNHCFVIGNLDSTREKYYLITNNEEELQTIFRPLGYSIVINRTLRVAQLVNLREWGRVEFQKYDHPAADPPAALCGKARDLIRQRTAGDGNGGRGGGGI